MNHSGQPAEAKTSSSRGLFHWPPFWLFIFLVLAVALALAACRQGEAGKPVEPKFTEMAPELGREYVLAIHPLHNSARLFEAYGPLLDYLNRNIPGAVFRLKASRNYEEFDKKLYARQFDFALSDSKYGMTLCVKTS